MGRRLITHLMSGMLAVLVGFCATPGRAAEPGWADMIDMFTAACLAKFPDDVAVRQYAGEERLAVMSDDVVHQLLGPDPGQGWIRDTERGRYLLTLEMPPFHTCAVRRTDSVAPDIIVPFSLLLGSWAATQSGASLKQLPTQNAQVSGFPTQVYQWILDRGAGKPAETLMLFVTNANNKVAVRLVHQIKAQ